MPRAIKETSKIDPKYVVTIDGHEFIKYPALLNLGHQKGLFKIEVEVLQIPVADNSNVAICKATVTSKDGEVFSDIGDASIENVGSRVRKHLLRMSSTRAIARALRSYTNVGTTCLEEIADISDAAVSSGNGGGKAEKPTARKRSTAAKPKPDDGNGSKGKPDISGKSSESRESEDSFPGSFSKQPRISQAQKRAIHSLAKRRKIEETELEEMAKVSYGTEIEQLTAQAASNFIQLLQRGT